MSEVFFELLSPLPLNLHDDARRLFGIWAKCAPYSLPDRSGLYEPLRKRFSLSSLEDAIGTWEMSFLMKRVASPKLEAQIFMQYGPHRRHSSWSITLRTLKDFDRVAFCNLFKTAGSTFLADFGLIHTTTASDLVRGSHTGSVSFLDTARKRSNLFVTTHMLRKSLPDIYWTTLFGLPYVDLFSRERLLSAPAYQVRELESGAVVVQLTAELADATRDETAFEQIRERVRRHLGSNAIFDPGKAQAHRYRVPEFTWLSSTS